MTTHEKIEALVKLVDDWELEELLEFAKDCYRIDLYKFTEKDIDNAYKALIEGSEE